MDEKEFYINFDEYIRQGEPQKRERADAWRVAIGLQAVDGLKTSEYLQQTARKNIEGEITIDEARELVKQYYVKKTALDEGNEDKEEADRVSTIRFLRNLLLGENNEMKNRYMMVDGPEEWKMPESEQVENKYRTSTEQVAEQVRCIISAVGKDQLTLKQIMERAELKHRPNFIDNYLNPAISDGYVRLLYPDKPKHPRQKYLLTVKGLAIYNDINNK